MERNDIKKNSSETAQIPVYKQSAEYPHQLIQLNISKRLSLRTIRPNRESFSYYIINPISLHMIASINPYIRTNKGYIQTRIATVWAKILYVEVK